MSLLIDEYNTKLIIIDRTTQPDGFGGVKTVWVDGAEFTAAMTPENSGTAKIAEAITEVKKYKIVTNSNITLLKDTYIKREKDGATFKVLRDNTDTLTPEFSTLDMRVTECERAEIPKTL